MKSLSWKLFLSKLSSAMLYLLYSTQLYYGPAIRRVSSGTAKCKNVSKKVRKYLIFSWGQNDCNLLLYYFREGGQNDCSLLLHFTTKHHVFIILERGKFARLIPTRYGPDSKWFLRLNQIKNCCAFRGWRWLLFQFSHKQNHWCKFTAFILCIPYFVR